MCVLTSPFLASSFSTHSVARRGSLLVCFPLAREIIAYCVGAVSTRYRLNRATKYEGVVSWDHASTDFILLLLMYYRICRFGLQSLIAICVCK